MPQESFRVACRNCDQQYGMAVFYCVRCGNPLFKTATLEAGGMVLALEADEGKRCFLTPVVRGNPVQVLNVQFQPAQNLITLNTTAGDFPKTAKEMFDALQQGEIWKLD